MSLNIHWLRYARPHSRGQRPTSNRPSTEHTFETPVINEAAVLEAELAGLSPEQRVRRIHMRRLAERIANGHAHVEAEHHAVKHWRNT